ncbi:MAG TPA: hypothetical protein VI934_01460 [Candidatus Nanoarchaeia archaeon]|nr:hypothetical protein [Candidatus Nanoarchaeia archaeon]
MKSATQDIEPLLQLTVFWGETSQPSVFTSERVFMVWLAVEFEDETVALNEVPAMTFDGTPETEIKGEAASAAADSMSMLTIDITRTTTRLFDIFIFKPPQICY